METFQDIARRTDAILKGLSSRWLKGAWKDEKEISRTLAILADGPSKDTYSKEILWTFLTTFLKGDIAASLAGMMTPEQWKRHVETMYRLDIHPEIEAPEGMRHILDIARTTTFVLEQYRYGDRVKVEPGDVCLDLGACFGDTAIWMAENGAASIHAFEIDPVNVEARARTLARNTSYGKISLEEMSVGSQPGSMYAVTNPYNHSASHITPRRPEGGAYREIPCVTQDMFCRERNIKPDFIKMDIEGSKPEAINGGVEVFRDMRPKFAICIYHTRDHRCQIPLRVAELCPDYDFYVKKSHPVFETVFFGCPREHGGMGDLYHSSNPATATFHGPA